MNERSSERGFSVGDYFSVLLGFGVDCFAAEADFFLSSFFAMLSAISSSKAMYSPSSLGSRSAYKMVS